MRAKLFLLAACTLIMACSSDDDKPEPNPELKIKKFIRMVYNTETNQNYTLTRTFDESGKPILQTEETTNDAIYREFTYNSNILISERIRSYQNNPVIVNDVFHYNSNNEIDSITSKSSQGDDYDTMIFEHFPNKIIYNRGQYVGGEYLYNANGVITEINTVGDISNSSTTITYASDNISQIIIRNFNGQTLTDTQTVSFQYDNGLNMLFPYFQNNYFNSTIGEYHYFLTGSIDYLSKNNYTQITYTNSDNSNHDYTITKNTTYDANGYPISSEVKKDNVLIEEHIYEYY